MEESNEYNTNYYIFLAYCVSILYAISIDVNLLDLFYHCFNLSIWDLENTSSIVEKKDKKVVPPIIPYPEKYLKEFKNLSDEKPVLIAESLKKNLVIDFTPVGNVAMTYDSERETFVYYSDNKVPYRFLEPVARKYVVNFQCKEIFIDMDEEVEKAKAKMENQKEKKEKEKKEKKERIENGTEKEKSKNVFATFKTYNKNITKDSSTKPTTNNNVSSKDETDIMVKEKTNRYTHEGRFSNFILMQKTDNKQIDSRSNVSFADFKKMQAKKSSL